MRLVQFGKPVSSQDRVFNCNTVRYWINEGNTSLPGISANQAGNLPINPNHGGGEPIPTQQAGRTARMSWTRRCCVSSNCSNELATAGPQIPRAVRAALMPTTIRPGMRPTS